MTENVPTTQTPLKFYTTAWCGDCRRSKAWLNRHQIAYDAIDIDEQPDAADYVMHINNGYRIIPTIVFPDGTILAEPTNVELAMQVKRVLGIATPDSDRRRDN